jgi:hypothetical protein
VAGPGKYSLDCALNFRLPRRLILVPGLLLAAGSVAYGVIESERVQQAEQATAQADVQPEVQAERPEAVRVPESPAAPELEERGELAAQEPERVSGAMLQAGEDAAHPV